MEKCKKTFFLVYNISDKELWQIPNFLPAIFGITAITYTKKRRINSKLACNSKSINLFGTIKIGFRNICLLTVINHVNFLVNYVKDKLFQFC